MLFNESLQDAKKIFNHQMQIKILEEQKNNYQLSKENIDSFNKTKHDLAHIFTSILYELDNNNQQQACNIITTQLNKLENLNKIIITGNDLIDYCISIKTNVIKTNNIKVICDCFEDNFPLNNEDLFIVFGNLLNNAIENCQSNPTKQILISSGIKNNFAYFKIRNTITKSVLKQNPQLITTKANHETHGLGIKNCHDIISKYHGYLDFSEDDLFFIVKVIIPIK